MSLLAKALRVRNDAPVAYASRRSGGSFGGGKSTGPLAKMGQVGTLFAIVNRTSTATAAPDWCLYRKPADGRPAEQDGEREQVTAHAAHALWARPNAHMTQADLIETVQQHIDLTGEGYLVVVRKGGIPVELWPVRPDRMTPVKHPTKFLTGWIYTDPDSEKVPLKADEVIQIRMPNPEDPYRGLGPVGAVLVDLEASQAAAEYNAAFFRNSAEPGGVIEVDRRLSDDEFDEMTQRWGEQHRGVSRAHRVAVLEQAKYVPRGYTRRDMEFTALRELSRDVIMEAFGISRATLGMTDGVNYAAAKAAKAQFDELLTVPRLERWKQALNARLLPMFGTTSTGVEFDYESPVRADEAAEIAERDSLHSAAEAAVRMGFTPESVQEAYGLPDALVFKAKPEPTPPPAFLPPGQVPPPSAEDEQPAPTARAHTHIHNAVDPGFPEAIDLAELAESWEKAHAAAMGQWEGVRATWRADLAKQIRKIVRRGKFAELAQLEVDPTDGASRLRKVLVEVTDRAYNGVVRDGANQGVVIPPRATGSRLTNQETGFRFGETEPVLNAAPVPPQEEPVPPDDVAATIAALLAAQIALSAGAEAIRLATPGVDADELVDNVIDFLTARSTASERAAFGGAITGAQNRGRRDAYAAGPVGSLYAVEKLDGNTCPPCSEVNGRFICTTDDLAPYDKLYTAMGGYVNCEGGIRCRGVVTGVWRPATTGGAQ